MALEGHGVQGAACSKQETVTSTKDGRHDESVDNEREARSTQSLQCDEIRAVRVISKIAGDHVCRHFQLTMPRRCPTRTLRQQDYPEGLVLWTY
jgi:hypothetical protein